MDNNGRSAWIPRNSTASCARPVKVCGTPSIRLGDSSATRLSAPVSGCFSTSSQSPRRGHVPSPRQPGKPATGWAIYISDGEGKAHVEQVYKTELDALRANKHNTDASRNVRFFPTELTSACSTPTPASRSRSPRSHNECPPQGLSGYPASTATSDVDLPGDSARCGVLPVN